MGSDLLVGELGLIARIDLAGGFHLIDTGTLDRIAALDTQGQTRFLLTRSGELLALHEESVERLTVPVGFRAMAGTELNDSSIALVDRRFRFAISHDSGETWQIDTTYATDDDQELIPILQGGESRIVAIGSDHEPIYFKDGEVVQIDRQTGQLSVLELPRKIRNNMTRVFETEAGLYIQTEDAGKPTTLNFLANGSDEWIKNVVGSYYGCNVSFTDSTGNNIEAQCGVREHPAHLESSDRGRTWAVVDPLD